MSQFENSRARAGSLPGAPVRWGLPDAAIGLVLAEAAIVATQLLRRLPGLSRSDWVGVSLTAAFYVLLVGYVFMVSRRRGLGGLGKDFGFELVWIDLIFGAGLVIAVQVANELVAGIAVGLLGLPPDPATNASLPSSQFWAVVDGLGIVSFLAPIGEELFFRGLMLRAIRNFVIHAARRGGAETTKRAGVISVAVSAIVFAAAHLYEATSPTEFVELGISTLVFGLGAGWVASRTGRLGPSIIAHMINNGIVTLAMLGAHAG